ncbi:hypothetical protein ABPG72_009031 [Tetrahymena utriculariae]
MKIYLNLQVYCSPPKSNRGVLIDQIEFSLQSDFTYSSLDLSSMTILSQKCIVERARYQLKNITNSNGKRIFKVSFTKSFQKGASLSNKYIKILFKNRKHERRKKHKLKKKEKQINKQKQN